MRRTAGIIGILFLLALVIGCAQTQPMAKAPSPSDLVDHYISKALEFENKRDLVQAIEHYRLALTVDNQNPLAKEKIAQLQNTLEKRVEQHYRNGLDFYQKGEYSRARREFLTALRFNPDHTEALRMLKEQKLHDQEVKGYLVHSIQADETVSVLAKNYYGDSRKFQIIAEYNQMEDATKIRSGQEIKVPIIDGVPFFKGPDEQITLSGEVSESDLTDVIIVKRVIIHPVQPNESLSKLAIRYYGDYTNFSLLAQYNQLSEDANLKVGQEIRIPEIMDMPFLEKMAEAAESKVEKSDTVIQETSPATSEETREQVAVVDQTIRYRTLGLALFEEKKFEDAIIAFKETLKRKPDDPLSLEYLSASHFQLGLIFFGKEDYLTARDEFQTSLKYNEQCEKCEDYIKKSEETYMDVHYKKGLIHFRDEDLEKAIEDWELVYNMDPEYKDVANNLKKVRLLIERLESIKQSKEEEGSQ